MAAILDSVVGSCARKLQDAISEEAILILGVKEELKDLRRTVNQIQCFLKDAEQRRIEESAVNNWLFELKDAMYEADDIIDLARIEGGKLLEEYPTSMSSSSSSLRKSTLWSDISVFSCLPNILKRHEIAARIKRFGVQLDKISRLGERFLELQNLQPIVEVQAVRHVKTWPLLEPNLVGKEILHSCSKLTELIHENKERAIYKIGIVGTGGVGKTTLAQKLYNDHKIKGLFSKQVWICVSQQYSTTDVFKQILRSLNVKYEQDETLGELSGKLAIAIQNTSFFIVLDDIWEHEVWTNLLRTPFCTAAIGIVVITTRNDTVARAIGVEYMHRVDLMSPEVGWELLCKSMNLIEDFEVQNFKHIGLEIVRLCGGLPLAIKIIASVLGTKERNENEWRKVINKSAWSMIKLPIDLRGALYLSYDELPRHLKQCFLYCGLYPEDSTMYCDELIRFWIAEGLVEEQETELLEDTAEDYYKELMYRNLLQPDPRFADYSRCKMHDLLRQLAQHLAGEDFFCGNPESLQTKSLSKLRHISIATGNEFSIAPTIQKKQIGVRTLTTKCKALKVENTIFKRLPKMRVLDLTDSVIVGIPDCIGKLIHLRSLVLDGTDVSYLPESICHLINLQILNLERCVFLHSLPLGITQLCNLRRLGLANTPINQVPKGIGRLEFLSDLEGFSVGCGCDHSTRMQNGWNLEELGPLLQLRKLDMVNLERAASCVTDSLLTGKRYLKILNLHCNTGEPYSEDDVINIDKIFEKLFPPPSVETLGIYQFFGRKYPSWLEATTHLSSLKYLQLKGCKSLPYLPPLGQLPSLKYLNIKEAAAITKIGSEFLGYGVSNPRFAETVFFPKLEMLIMLDMPEWEEWTWTIVDIEQEEATGTSKEVGNDGANAQQPAEALPPRMQLMPQLNILELINCPKLRSLPWNLGHIATRLKELYLRQVTSIKLVEDLPFLSGRLLIADCDSLERVSNIPHVHELCVGGCPSLMCVEKLDNLRLLRLHESMQEVSSLWLPGLQQQCSQLHTEDLDVINWT